MAIDPCYRSRDVPARPSSQKKNRPGAAGEVGFNPTVSILFQNGFFSKEGRPSTAARGLTFPGTPPIGAPSVII
jgi:hypothetical protein